MPRTTVEDRPPYKFPDDVLFPVTLLEVEEITIPFHKKDRKTKQPLYDAQRNPVMDEFTKWRWTFEIADDEHVEEQYRGEKGFADTRPEFTTRPDDKVRLFSEALLGAPMDVGDELDTDVLLGLQAWARFRHGEARQQRDGTMFYPCEVDELLPWDEGQNPEEPPF